MKIVNENHKQINPAGLTTFSRFYSSSIFIAGQLIFLQPLQYWWASMNVRASLFPVSH